MGNAPPAGEAGEPSKTIPRNETATQPGGLDFLWGTGAQHVSSPTQPMSWWGSSATFAAGNAAGNEDAAANTDQAGTAAASTVGEPAVKKRETEFDKMLREHRQQGAQAGGASRITSSWRVAKSPQSVGIVKTAEELHQE